MADTERRSVHVFFSRSPDYRTIAANGAWGGIAPTGDIVFDLYVDRVATPESMDLLPEEGGTLMETRHPAEQPILRELQIGVVLRPDIAKSVGEFLIKYADQSIGIAEKGHQR